MPFISEPIFPMANNDLTPRNKMIVPFPARHQGKGKVTFILQFLKSRTGNVLVNFQKSIFGGWIGEYSKLKRLVPNGQIARITLYNKGDNRGTAIKSQTITSSFFRNEYRFEFDLSELQNRETWCVEFTNLTDYHLFFRYELSIPKNREDHFVPIDLKRASRLIDENLAGLSMVLDTANGSTITLPVPNAPQIPFPLPAMNIPQLGTTVSITDLRSDNTTARYTLNTNAPSGLALNIDLSFESEGHEGRMQLLWEHTIDIENLRLAITLPLEVRNRVASYDRDRLDCVPEFDDLDVSGFPDSIVDFSSEVKNAIRNSVMTALRTPNTVAAITEALTFLFMITTGINPDNNDVIGAEQASGETRLHLITTHPE